MFTSTRLNVFVCLALGLAANAAPTGLESATNLGANANTGKLVAADLESFANGDANFGANVPLDTAVNKRIISEILGQGTGLIDGLGLDGLTSGLGGLGGGLGGGLSGGASTSTGTTTDGTSTDTSAGGFGSLLSSGLTGGALSGSSSTGLGTSFGRRSDVFGGSASASSSSDGLLDNLVPSDLLNGDANFGANVDIDTSVNKRIISDVLGQGTGLLDSLGLSGLTSGAGGLSGGLGGGLSGGASTSADTTADGTSTDTSAGGFGSLLNSGLTGFGGLGGSSSTGLGTSFGARGEVE